MGRHLVVGNPVVVSFDPRDITVVEDMRQFNGMETTISKVHIAKTMAGRQFGQQFELVGVRSTIGNMPYFFTRDMLVDDTEVEL